MLVDQITRTGHHFKIKLYHHDPRGGGALKHFFDRDARPRTNFNYPKNRMTPNSNPKK